MNYKSCRPHVLQSSQEQDCSESWGLKEGITEQIGPGDAAHIGEEQLGRGVYQNEV